MIYIFYAIAYSIAGGIVSSLYLWLCYRLEESKQMRDLSYLAGLLWPLALLAFLLAAVHVLVCEKILGIDAWK